MGFTFGADATDGKNRQRVSGKEKQVSPKDDKAHVFFPPLISCRQQ